MDKKTERRIISALRKIWYYSYERQRVYKAAKKADKYQCAQCKKLFDRVQIDHIEPIGTVKNKSGGIDFSLYIERLFCDESNLQALCPTHHKEKTKKEAEMRRKKYGKG